MKKMSEEEKQQALREGKTRGKKCCRLPRIHMSLAPENIDYIEVMSRLSGTTKGTLSMTS